MTSPSDAFGLVAGAAWTAIKAGAALSAVTGAVSAAAWYFPKTTPGYYFGNWMFYETSNKLASEIKKLGVSATLDNDPKFSGRVINISSFDDAVKVRDEILKFATKDSEAAQVGDYVSIKLTDNQYVHIHGSDLVNVRKEVLCDDRDYKYSVSFKNAQYHAYMSFENLHTDAKKVIGASVKPIAAKHGDLFIRDDGAYEDKYFRGHEPVSANAKRDQASFAVKFLITEEQFEKMVEKFHQDNERLGLSGNGEYSFETSNCHSYIYSHYKNDGFTAHHYKFANSNEIDLNDQGSAYSFLLAQTTDVEKIMPWPLSELNKIIGACYAVITAPVETAQLIDSYKSFAYSMMPSSLQWSLDKADCCIPDFVQYAVLNSIGVYRPSTDFKDILLRSFNDKEGSIAEANKQDEQGNTAIHQLLLSGNIEQAMSFVNLGADVDIPNHKGETVLHLAAGLPKSSQKMELLKNIIAHTTNINAEDKYSTNIPLTKAALANDAESMKLLIDNGANVGFLNSDGDKIIHIVAEAFQSESDFAVADLIFNLDRDQFLVDNGTRQIPLHHPNFKGHFDGKVENAPEPKDEIGLYLHIPDVKEFFAELHQFTDDFGGKSDI